MKPSGLFRNDNITIRTLMFLIAIIIIVSLLPFKNKFKYEYEEGNKWNHENLFAPFDFAILKNKKDIDREKDSVLSDFKPYFQFDKSVYLSESDIFKQNFEYAWKDYLNNNLHYNYNNYDNTYISTLKNSYFKFASDILENVYNKGIISIPKFLLKDNNKSFPFVLENNNLAIENDLSNVLTEATAADYLKNSIKSSIAKDSMTIKVDKSFIAKLNLAQLISPNIIYDYETSSNIRKDLLNNISLTKGLIQAGEKIITRNEIIDKNKFNILQSLKNEYETANLNTLDTFLIIFGHAFLVTITLLVIYLFLFNFRKDILRSNLKISFILLLVLVCVIIAVISIHFDRLNLYIIPFAILPIIIRTFYDTRLALFVHIATMLIIGLIAPNGFEFVFLQIITGMIAIFSLASVRRRNQIFFSALLIFCTYSLVHFSISIIYNGGLVNIEWKQYMWFLGNCLLLLLSYPLIYLFEKIFGFLSDVTLLELSDTNRTLLRTLEEKAPGTYQHSLQVANLCEETIYKIGGDPLLVRAGALYHDIGKMDIPYFFIENQVLGFNPHDEIDFEKSAEIIISHVEHGVKIAKKNGIPEPIIDFIRTHHGNSKVQFFYKSFIKKYPESEVEIDKFTYPGPCPFSKETSVLMMADSVEAASRSLKIINEKTISDLVEQIITYQINENLHADANLTFKDVSVIKKILKKKLKNIYHERIQYPG